jgi:hypothetical protein
MNASNLELRHRKLLHQLLVAAAFVTYLYDPDDIVWRFVKNSSASHQWERALFLAASIAIFAGAVLCTWSRADRKAESNSSIAPGSQVDGTQALGEILYAVGLASLFPLSGFLILVIGETLRVVRLVSPTADSVRSDHLFQGPRNPDFSPDAREKQRSDAWGTAFRIEFVKWGIVITMIVFVITLTDRVAEYLAGASFLIGMLLNAPIFGHTRQPNPAD